jgi:hypothetical protein
MNLLYGWANSIDHAALMFGAKGLFQFSRKPGRNTLCGVLDQPAAFDLLQHGVRALDNALQAMVNVTELIDDVDDADKRSDNDKYLDRRYREAQAYESLDHLLTTALDKSATLQSRLADYHKASPELALALALAGGRRQGLTNLPRPNSAPVKSRGFSLLRMETGLPDGGLGGRRGKGRIVRPATGGSLPLTALNAWCVAFRQTSRGEV